MLHLPYQLCVKSLPTEVKQAIADKLSKYQPDNTVSRWNQQYWTDHVQTVLNFLNTPMPDQPRYFKEFHYYTRGLDRSRDQNFETTLPEFAALVRPWFESLDQLPVVDAVIAT